MWKLEVGGAMERHAAAIDSDHDLHRAEMGRSVLRPYMRRTGASEVVLTPGGASPY
jgi:hypothetical protein